MAQPENLFQGQEGLVKGTDDLMPPSVQPQAYGQPLPPVAQQFQQPNLYPGQPILGQPVPQGQLILTQQPIIVNQYVQTPPMLRTTPAAVVCPHCKNNIITVVDIQFSCLNCCFCYCFFPFWIIVNLINKKEFNCQDATHKCPMCGQLIQQYNAC